MFPFTLSAKCSKLAARNLRMSLFLISERLYFYFYTDVSSDVASYMYVVDGRALLHRVMWPHRADVIQEHVELAAYKYGRQSPVCVLFFGYKMCKGQEKLRREQQAVS